MTTETAHELVQPTMLLVDKEDPADATDAIRAVAEASVQIYLDDCATGARLHVWDTWEEWLDGPFTKSVCRADNKTFDIVLAGLVRSDYTLIHVGKARAAVFHPVPAAGMPKRLAKLQVSGTQLPDRVPSPAAFEAPIVIVNSGLGMSTGKAAAQAAHALFLYHLTVHRAFEFAGCEVQLVADAEFQRLLPVNPEAALITDARRTEIEPGSVTAFCVEKLIG